MSPRNAVRYVGGARICPHMPDCMPPPPPSWLVVYEDGDREDLDWGVLWPLIRRGEAAGLPQHDPRTGKVVGEPAAAAGRAKVTSTAGAATIKGRVATSPAMAAAVAAGRTCSSGQRSQQHAAPAAAALQEAAQPKKSGRPAHGKSPWQQLQKVVSTSAAEQENLSKNKLGRPPKQQQEVQQAGNAAGSAKTAAKQAGVAAAAAAATAQPPKQRKQQAEAGEGCRSDAGGKKRKQSGDVGGSTGGGEPKKRRQWPPSGPSVDLPEPKMGEQHVYEYKRGKQAWNFLAGGGGPSMQAVHHRVQHEKVHIVGPCLGMSFLGPPVTGRLSPVRDPAGLPGLQARSRGVLRRASAGRWAPAQPSSRRACRLHLLPLSMPPARLACALIS